MVRTTLLAGVAFVLAAAGTAWAQQGAAPGQAGVLGTGQAGGVPGATAKQGTEGGPAPRQQGADQPQGLARARREGGHGCRRRARRGPTRCAAPRPDARPRGAARPERQRAARRPGRHDHEPVRPRRLELLSRAGRRRPRTGDRGHGTDVPPPARGDRPRGAARLRRPRRGLPRRRRARRRRRPSAAAGRPAPGARSGSCWRSPSARGCSRSRRSACSSTRRGASSPASATRKGGPAAGARRWRGPATSRAASRTWAWRRSPSRSRSRPRSPGVAGTAGVPTPGPRR